MASISDCYACRAGDHANHRYAWNVKKGLLGGSVCGCKGDCKERAKKRFEKQFGDLAATLADPVEEESE